MGAFAHPLVTVHAMEIGQEIDVTKRFVFQTVTMVVYVYHQTSVSAQVTMKESCAAKVKCTLVATDTYT